jgi:isochorismate synthase
MIGWESIGSPGHFSTLSGGTQYGDYLGAFSKMKEEIINGYLEKVVLARTRDICLEEEIDLSGLFLKLEELYPAAFVYLLSLPGCGIWAGATPELLFEKTGETAGTVALAGTKVHQNTKIEWSDKELHEQEVVSRYIEEVLTKNGVQFCRTGPETSHAGHLAHLKTVYRFPAGSAFPANLITDLHPTPAVCGFPADKAIEAILRNERIDRAYYTGYLGPVDQEGETRLFVNLRCLHVEGKKLILFAGGGLTEGSEVNREWEETEQKTRTLLSVIEKL